MKLFKKNSNMSDNPISNKAANGIANGILKLQLVFANGMQQWTGKWQQGQKRIFLLMVCTVFGGLSCYYAAMPFIERVTAIEGLKPQSIILPKKVQKDHSIVTITTKEFKQVQAFKQQLSNLQKTPVGKKQVDSLMKQCPGLMDSLQWVEQIYYSQQK